MTISGAIIVLVCVLVGWLLGRASIPMPYEEEDQYDN